MAARSAVSSNEINTHSATWSAHQIPTKLPLSQVGNPNPQHQQRPSRYLHKAAREILPLLRARANGEKEGTTTSTINVPCSGQNIQKLQARAHTIRHANTTASPAAVSTITVTVTITTIPDYCLTAVHFSPIPIVPTATLTQASSLLAAASAALQSATATTGPANTSISIITPAPAPVPIIPAPKLIGTAANAGIPQGANSTLPRLTPTPTSTTIGAAAPIQPVRGDASSFTRREEFSIAVSTALGILLFDWVFVPFLRAMAERATRAVKRE
ncbi:uncharacterized protein KY384_005742 [Bacidia gigantensis]|uniref:uncharacterized protein n=1 Tax=Bacidia gigantensis TaxID=2732470 RepID=UPI001D051882|nr:uncharacterized protein KY384_005742 [Bacidia gigantensis]KAG8529107.1 hypothetical protein KY384_005742 [Bacidia gigantensis]